MNDWKVICRVEDIPVLGSRRVARPRGMDVAVFRNDEDQVFALLDRCPHKGGPLSQGIVFGTSVACPLHNWTIGLAGRLRQRARRRLRAADSPARWRPASVLTRELATLALDLAIDGRPAASCARPADVRRAGRTDVRNQVHLPLLRRGLRRHHRERRRPDHRRARRPGASRQLRPAVHQGLDAAPDGHGARSRGRRGCCTRCGASSAATAPVRVAWDSALDFAADTLRADHPRARPATRSASTSRASC